MGLPDRPACRYALDVVLATSVAAFATIAALLSTQGTRDLDARGYAMLLVGSFALVARRRFPIAVLVVAALSALCYQASGYPGLMTTLPVPFAVYTAVSAGRRRAAIIAVGGVLLAVSIGVSVVPYFESPMRELAETKFMLLGWLFAAGVLAETSLHRRAYIAEVERRAHDAERTREETARRRAGDERLRIARDLHDSLTHSISVIKVQAGVAVHLARKKGDEVPASLLAIEEASSDAIRELRSTLDVLRQAGADPDGETSGNGLDRLDDLVERTRTAAGVPTTVSLAGDASGLDPAVDEAAYRIIQESLTNVARHAGPDARAKVDVSYGSDTLTIRVDDDGRALPDHGPIPGVGLIGMRERVTALGGHLRAGPRDTGGFSVTASLPLRVNGVDHNTDPEDADDSSAEPSTAVEAPVEVRP